MSEAADASTQQFQADAGEVLDHPGVDNITNVVHEVEALDFGGVVKESKAGYKTTEFWLTILSGIGVATDAVPTPHDTKGYALVVLVALYAIARGIAKRGIPSIEPSPVSIAPAATEADVVALAPTPDGATPGI